MKKRIAQLSVLREDLARKGYEYENQSAGAKNGKVGMYYTPLEMAARVVEKALHPFLFREDGTPRKLEEILSLRIFDPALGAGVFLLETCFQLTRFLVEQGEEDPKIPAKIAKNCLFGADIDAGAVQIAREVLTDFCKSAGWTDCESETAESLESALEKNLICADSLKLWKPTKPQKAKKNANLSETSREIQNFQAKMPFAEISEEVVEQTLEVSVPNRFASVLEAGFDVILGNPPYLGGRKIRRVLGDAYFCFLTREFTAGESGNADLCVYFLRLAERLLRPGGICGFITTNTISEGDSRKAGLEVLLANGGEIYAVETLPWSGKAAVYVTILHLYFPPEKYLTQENWSHKKLETGIQTVPPRPAILHGKAVPQIYASLKHLDTSLTSHSFSENETLCYQGCVLAAKGFILTPREAEELWGADSKYREVVLPYFTGDDVFSSSNPMQMRIRRCVISFQSLGREEAEEKYPLAFEIVRERVLPVRRTARRTAHRERWWQFGDKRPALMKVIQEKKLQKILLQTRHSKFLLPTWVPTDAIYSESTILFPSESPELLSVLNSGIHEVWVRETSSSLGNELRYSPTDCFNTFPLPEFKYANLDFWRYRNQLCREWNCGLTQLWNRLHDPEERGSEIEKLRELCIENEAQVLAAYRWDDLTPRHEFHETERGIRFELEFDLQTEILNRLTRAQNFRFLYS